MRKIRFLVIIPIIIYAVISSISDDNRRERNERPKELVRQAHSITGMWSGGISADRIPNFSPAQAGEYLQEAIDSDADDEVKQQAREAQQFFDNYPHYVRFANDIGQFTGEFDHLREVVRGIPASDGFNNPGSLEQIPPKCLVVTAKQHESLNVDDKEDPLFLDAQFMNALGDSLATSPDELNSLIALYFYRNKVGEYEFGPKGANKGAAPAPMPLKMNAYHHVCRIVVFDLSTNSISAVHQIGEHDPEERTVTLFGGGTAEKDGYDFLREKVVQWIQQVPAADR